MAQRAAAGAVSALLVLAAVLSLQDRAPRQHLPTWLARLPAADPLRFFADTLAARKVTLSNITRNAIFPASGSLLRSRDLAGGDRMELAAALMCPPGVSCQGRYRLALRQAQGDRAALFSTTLSLAPEERPVWTVHRLTLPGAPGEPIGLEVVIEAEVPDGAAKTVMPTVVLAEPLRRGMGSVSASLATRGSGGAREPHLNVVLISIDTLRADRLGIHGYRRDTSPHIDALARAGTRFARAISQAPWTTPSHMSLMTSLYPSTHRLNQDFRWFDGFHDRIGRYRALAPAAVTLAEVLRAHGYQNVAIVGGGTVAGALGFAQGFDVYEEGRYKLTAGVWDGLLDALNELAGQPFFLFFHTFEVHAPYSDTRFAAELLTQAQIDAHDALFASIRAEVNDFGQLRWDQQVLLKEHGLFRAEVTSALYDGGIHYTDAFLGRLFAELERLHLADRTLIIVTSDHGEEFGDHDPTRIYDSHCNTMYDELIHVPLILRAPGRIPAGSVVNAQVELIDVAPTILDLLGFDTPASMQGRSLVPLINGTPAPEREWALSEATCIGPEWKALRSERYKLVTAFAVAHEERGGIPGPVKEEALFDLHADPGEHHDARDRDAARTRSMRERLRNAFARAARAAVTGETRVVTEDVSERLRALGYLDNH